MTETSASVRTPKLGESFSPTRNSLNFLRLVFASAVIASHAVAFGRFGSDNILRNETTLGTLAVYGFFGISGYLIAASASNSNLGRFLWHRFLRIFPAFWVCLVVTATVFGSLTWNRALHGPHCQVTCYLHHYGLNYVASNILLRINRVYVAPYDVMQNSALWTLFYEFLCYLFLAALAVLGLLKRRSVVALMALGLWAAELVVTIRPHHFSSLDGLSLLTLGPVFLTGTLIYLYRDLVWDHWLIAVACLSVFVASIWFPIGRQLIDDRPSSVDVFAVSLVYPTLWLGIHLPFRRIGTRNDYSYGVYIYGTPVLVLFALWRFYRWGYFPYLIVCLAVSFVFAALSWWLIEKRALRLKKMKAPAFISAFGSHRPDRVDGAAFPTPSTESD